MPTGVYVRTAEARAKNSAAHLGKKLGPYPPERGAAIRAAKRAWSPERRAAVSARMSAAQKTRLRTPEMKAATSAAISAAQLGRPKGPMSAETKAKIGAANKGMVRTAEFCARMSATRLGKKHGPCPPERGAAISAAKKAWTPEHRDEVKARMSAAQAGRKCKPFSETHRKNIGAAAKGKSRPQFSQEWRDNIGAAGVGRKHSAETRAKRSAALRRAWEEGRHSVNVSYKYTSLARTLHAYLESTLGVALEPEVRFGRFTVDLYDRTNHAAYEADGTYWHDKNEAARPGYHANRDAYLRERFGLTVTHYTDVEIETLTKRRAS